MSKPKKEQPQPSPEAIAHHPDPRREMYFNDADFKAAIARVHERRLRFDRINGR